MSKESKPRLRWHQVFAAAWTRPEHWCHGCGYHRVATGTHRPDCNAEGAW